MASSPTREPPVTSPAAVQKLIGLTSLLDPWAVRAAATFRLPDLVAEGADTIGELAIRSETHPDGLGRLMRHLTLLGLFRTTADGCFEVTEMGEALRDGHPIGIRSTLDQTNPFLSRLDQSAHGLLQAVRTGGPAWEHLHGLSFWDNMTAEPGFGEGYDAQMNQHSAMFGAAIARSYDWSSVRHVIDVGGGWGVPWRPCCASIRTCAVAWLTFPAPPPKRLPSSRRLTWPTGVRLCNKVSWTRCPLAATPIWSPTSSTTGTTRAPPAYCGAARRPPGRVGGCCWSSGSPPPRRTRPCRLSATWICSC